MGRPRQFDETDALNAAMHVFWLKGYEATSMTDLMEAMNLHKGSIYKAFGDKHTLFMTALKHYLAQGDAGLQRSIVMAPTPIEAIRGFLRLSLRQCTTGTVIRGCFMMNSLVELAPHDDDVRELIADYMSKLEAHLSSLVEKGQRSGQFRTDRTAKELVSYLMFVKAGFLTGSKAGLTSQDPFTVIDVALGVLF